MAFQTTFFFFHTQLFAQLQKERKSSPSSTAVPRENSSAEKFKMGSLEVMEPHPFGCDSVPDDRPGTVQRVISDMHNWMSLLTLKEARSLGLETEGYTSSQTIIGGKDLRDKYLITMVQGPLWSEVTDPVALKYKEASPGTSLSWIYATKANINAADITVFVGQIKQSHIQCAIYYAMTREWKDKTIIPERGQHIFAPVFSKMHHYAIVITEINAVTMRSLQRRLLKYQPKKVFFFMNLTHSVPVFTEHFVPLMKRIADPAAVKEKQKE